MRFLQMIPSAGEIAKAMIERFGDGAVHEPQSVIDELAGHFRLSPEDLEETDGSHPRFYHKIHSVLAQHLKKGLLIRPARGQFRYMPNELAKHQPRRHGPKKQPKPASDDQFPIRDFVELSGIVARNGKDKVIRVLQSAF
jgi:hypothetical protein